MNWLGSNLDESWRIDALCAQTGPDDATWFAGNGIKPTEAQALCAGCEVRNDCLDYALANEEKYGVWAGLSERELRALVRAKKEAS